MKTKLANTVVGLVVSALFLWFALRNVDLGKVWTYIVNSNFYFIGLAVLLYFTTFIFRSKKWRLQLLSMHYQIDHLNSLNSIILHYFGNSISIKLGAVFRSIYLKNKTQIPVSTSIGVFVSENIFDFLAVILAILATLIINFGPIAKIFSEFAKEFHKQIALNNIILLIVLVLVVLSAVLIFYFYSYLVSERNKKRLNNFVDAVKQTFGVKPLGIFVLWQVLLWISLLLMNWFVFEALFEETANLQIIFTLTTLIYVSWLIPSPGGIGSVQYFSVQALAIYGFSIEKGIAFGIVSNALTLLVNLLSGSLVMIFSKKV